MKRFVNAVLVMTFILVLVSETGWAKKNIFQSLLKIYTTYEEVNMLMWLTGDIKAEKRFGQEVKWIIQLTNKQDKNPETNRWVSSVFERVKAQFRDRGLNYNITVLQGDTVNAFAIPGGSVFVYDGILKLVSSDDELAAVLAHELTHSERRHSLKQLRTSAAFQLLLQKAVKNQKDRDTWGQVAGALTMLKFSREDEDEADDIGQRRMFQAGFNPAAQVTLWEKFVQKFGKGGGVEQYFSSHPPSQSRVDNARKNLIKLQVPANANIPGAPVVPNVPAAPSVNLSYNILADVEENLLQNSSFETDLKKRGFPDAWDIREGKASMDSRESVTGKFSMVLLPESGIRPVRVVSEMISVNLKEKYVLRGWIKAQGAGQRANVGAEIYDRSKKLRGFVWPGLGGLATQASWQRFETVFEAGGNAAINFPKDAAFMRVILQAGPMSQGAVWFDDLNVKRGSNIAQKNYLGNGSFEIAAETGLPLGVSGTPEALSRDTTYFRVGYAALKLVGGKANETEASFDPVPMGEIKDGQQVQFSGQYSGNYQGKVKVIINLIKSSEINYERRLLEREFEIKPQIWQNMGGRFDVRLSPEEKSGPTSLQIEIAAPIPATGALWLDGFVMK